jgi:uncharacterized membrane protein
MPSFLPPLKKTVIFVHRWMGVALCALFVLWFASGIGMMYWDYPSVTGADRLRHERPLDPGKIRVSPQDAYALLQINHTADGIRLGSFDGRPAYRFRFGRSESVVYADTGETQTDCSPDMSGRIAPAWAGEPAAGSVEILDDQDQWTVPGEFKDLLPLRKYSWPDGRRTYVSTATCRVEQFTTRASRVYAYLSAIPHWLYFTPLRKHTERWTQVVVWTSGLGTISAILGLVIGLWMYSPSKRYRYARAPSSIPYVGMKRWHTILGLVFGVLACTWVFSGMLSMDPFPNLQEGDSDVAKYHLAAALRGSAASLSLFAKKPPQQALLEAGPNFQSRELALISVMGEPVYLATAAPGETLIIPVRGAPRSEFDRRAIVGTLEVAEHPYAAAEVRLVVGYESYYIDRHKTLPLPVIFVRFNDPERSMYYIDPKTASIVQGYNSRSRWNRWLYHGLHSMDFPWLYESRPSWDILLVSLLIGGTALCVTSLWLSWTLLRRKALAVFGERFNAAAAPRKIEGAPGPGSS